MLPNSVRQRCSKPQTSYRPLTGEAEHVKSLSPAMKREISLLT